MTTDLPPGWVCTTLGDLGRYHNGRAFKSADWAEVGRPIIRIQNLTGSGSNYNHFDGQVDSRHVVSHGDLLVSWAATLGVYVWRGPEAVLNQHIFKVESHISPQFHRWLLESVVTDLYRQAHGSGMVHITKKKFEQTPVRLPPAAEQERIVAAIEEHFSRLDAVDASLEAAVSRCRDLVRPILASAFRGRLVPQESGDEPVRKLLDRIAPARSGTEHDKQAACVADSDYFHFAADDLPPGWGRARFGDIAETQLGKMLSASSRQGLAPVPYPRNQNVQWHRIDMSDVAYMDFTDDERVKYRLQPGDLLICEGGEVGRCARWTAPSVEMYFQKALHRVRPRNGIEIGWIEYFMRWAADTGRFAGRVQGSTIAHLPQRDLRALSVPIAPTEEQRRIVTAIGAHLARLELVQAGIAEARRKLEATRRSVLASALRGRLVTGGSGAGSA